MADGNELESIINEPSEAEKRIKQLSGKVKEEAEAREAERAAREAAEAKAAEYERNAAFSEGFADIVATNPAAKDFKDDIKAKVLSGYSVEDATYAVLGKAGKLNNTAPEPEPTPAGGSAVTTPPQGGARSAYEMTQEERRKALLEAQARGDISLS